jgi:hypothetical protein
MVLVRATTLNDWQALREIRMQALRDAPDAFASTYAGEAAFGADEWHQRATRDGSFIAFLPEVAPAGLGGGYLASPEVVELMGDRDQQACAYAVRALRVRRHRRTPAAALQPGSRRDRHAPSGLAR